MSTPQNYILLPFLVQILLSLGIFVYLAIAKSRALKDGVVDLDRRALHNDAWPEYVQKINNNIRNQFEIPVLFYALVLALYVLESADLFAQVLAWLFALSRIVHAYIHTGSNYVPYRRPVFMFGCIVLIMMLFLASQAVVR